MPIQLGLMGPVALPFGYFFSAALLTVAAAVVIGAFWVGWGLLSPAGGRKDPPPRLAASSVARKEKVEEDGSAETDSVRTATEGKDAGTGMASVPVAMVRGEEEKKGAVAAGLCCAATAAVVHELVEQVGVALVAGDERVLPDTAPSTVERVEKCDGLAEIAPLHAANEEEKDNDLAEIAPTPAATVEGKDPLAADVCATHPALKGEEKVHGCAEQVAVAREAGEEGDPADMVAPSRPEREDTSAETAPVHTEKDNKDALSEVSPRTMPREDGKDVLAVDLCATPAVEGGEKKVHDLVEGVDVALVAGEERDVLVEEVALPAAEDTNKVVDGPMRTEAADKLEIGELTLEELKAYDGSDAERPLLMAIKGHIYDVSRSRVLYGPGGHNEQFGGRDVTRALALMSFEPEDLTGKIDDLKKAELQVLGDWEQKFMEKYPIVGRLVAVKSGD